MTKRPRRPAPASPESGPLQLTRPGRAEWSHYLRNLLTPVSLNKRTQSADHRAWLMAAIYERGHVTDAELASRLKWPSEWIDEFSATFLRMYGHRAKHDAGRYELLPDEEISAD